MCKKTDRNILGILFIVFLLTGFSYLLTMYFSLTFELLFQVLMYAVLVLDIVLLFSKLFYSKERPKNVLSLQLVMIAGIGIFSLYLFLDHNHYCRTRRGMEHNSRYFIGEVGREMLLYAERNKVFPDKDQWCDNMLHENQSLESRYFSSGDGQNKYCKMAFNEKLSNLKFDEASPGAILLIEATGPWNFSGGGDLINANRDRDQYYSDRDKFVFLFFVDSKLAKYRLRDGAIAFYESGKNSFSKWYKKGESLYGP